jgi:hypothetical protein
VGKKMSKLIAFLIIVLFFGVAIAPSIIADKQENNDYVTFTTEFCGLGKKHSIDLTNFEANEIDLLLARFNHQLKNIRSKEELDILIKNVVDKLDSYDLFGDIEKQEIMKLIQLDKIQNKIVYDNPTPNIFLNLYCFVGAHSHQYGYYHLGIANILSKIFAGLGLLLLPLYFILGVDDPFHDPFIVKLCRFFDDLAYGFPLRLLNTMIIRDTSLFTLGLKGIKVGMNEVMVIGFTGIRLIEETPGASNYIDIGFAIACIQL